MRAQTIFSQASAQGYSEVATDEEQGPGVLVVAAVIRRTEDLSHSLSM